MRGWPLYGILLLFFISVFQAGYLLFQVEQYASQVEATGKASAGSFGQVNICVNRQPILGVPCNSTATRNTTYTCYLNGSDGDNASQNITFNVTFSVSTLFTINTTTGLVNFSPSSSQVGNHTLNFTLQDNSSCGNGKVFQLFNLTINAGGNRPPVLTKNISSVTFNEGQTLSLFFLTNHFSDPDGDTLTFTVSSQSTFSITINSNSEVVINATTCGKAEDVIFTAKDPSNETADSNLVSITCNKASAASAAAPTTTGGEAKCLPKYECFDHTLCSKDGFKTKRCLDENGCKNDVYITVVCKPLEAEACSESWTCSEWGDCLLNGRQYRTCRDLNSCGSSEKRPEEERLCQFSPSCFDGLKDGDETGMDCGGNCKPCVTLEAPALIKEDLRPLTYILLVLTLLGFGLLMINKYYHKQVHRWLVRGGWYLSGRYEKVILLNAASKKDLLEALNALVREAKEKKAEKLLDKMGSLVEDYFRAIQVTPKASPHYRRAKEKRSLPNLLESFLDLFYGHMKHLRRKEEAAEDLVRFGVEEFRAMINLTSSSEIKVPYDGGEVKVDEHLHPAERVRLKIINAWVALQFNEVSLAQERYEELVGMYEALDSRSKRALYEDVYRLYQEIRYANSLLDIDA